MAFRSDRCPEHPVTRARASHPPRSPTYDTAPTHRFRGGALGHPPQMPPRPSQNTLAQVYAPAPIQRYCAPVPPGGGAGRLGLREPQALGPRRHGGAATRARARRDGRMGAPLPRAPVLVGAVAHPRAPWWRRRRYSDWMNGKGPTPAIVAAHRYTAWRRRTPTARGLNVTVLCETDSWRVLLSPAPAPHRASMWRSCGTARGRAQRLPAGSRPRRNDAR
jgi:hypothetical protein